MAHDDRGAISERMLKIFDRRIEIEAVWLFPPRSPAGAPGVASTDLGVLFTDGGAPPDPTAWAERLAQELDRLGVSGPRVILLERAEPTLRHRAIERGQAIFFRDMAKVREFRARAWMEYVDGETPASARIAGLRRPGLASPVAAHERTEVLRQHTERISATLRAGGERFATDRTVQDSILFNLIQACQAVEDLAIELASAPTAEEPGEDNDDPIGELARRGLIPLDLATRLGAVLRLRNVVLYRYAELDLGVLLKHLPAATAALTELASTCADVATTDEPRDE